MEIEKLIEAVRLCGSTPKVDQCKRCAYWAAGDMSRCIPNMTGDAATALSTLQAENAQLRVDLEYEREHANAYHEECGQWEAENEKLRAYANDAYGTMYNMYGAGGKYCDEKILAFWRRWNGKKEDA